MTKRKGGLGRGIGALIPTSSEQERPQVTTSDRPVDVFFQGNDADTRVAEEQLVQVPGLTLAHIAPSDIVPNAQQPRKVFDEQDLAELVHSVKEFGVLQPIVVRPKAEGGYELVMGERRWRASQLAGLTEIPAVIKQTADDEMLRDALLENLHRSELNPLEEASAYQQLLADFGITQEELASRIGRSRPQVSNTLRLLKLPEAVQSKVAAGVLSAGHARAVLSVADQQHMLQLANKIINEDLSVRQAEAIASGQKKTPVANKPKPGAVRGQLNEVAERLEDRLNTSVRISLTRKKGQLVIDFATIADLNRILDELGVEGYGSR